MGDIRFNDGHKYSFVLRMPESGVTTDTSKNGKGKSLHFASNGRSFNLIHDGVFNTYRIAWDRGDIPAELDQTFTQVDLAGKAIASYFDRLDFDEAHPVQMVRAYGGSLAPKGTIDGLGLPKVVDDES